MPEARFTIDVQTEYLPQQSLPGSSVFTFACRITITNTGKVPAQLISRCWNINDAKGVHQKVKEALHNLVRVCSVLCMSVQGGL